MLNAMNEKGGIVLWENNEFLRLILSYVVMSIHKTQRWPDCNCVSTNRRRRDATAHVRTTHLWVFVDSIAFGWCCYVMSTMLLGFALPNLNGFVGQSGSGEGRSGVPFIACLLVHLQPLMARTDWLSFMCRCEPSALSEPSNLPAYLPKAWSQYSRAGRPRFAHPPASKMM